MKKVNRLLKTIIFSVLLILALSCFVSVFRFKYGDGIYSLDKFYELPQNSVDVLVLGSSHAFENINPAIFYSEYGITAFDLTGSIQPLWNTYYYLYEALKTQSPRIVVLEAYCTTLGADYIDESRIIKNTYGMKPSVQYIDALKISAPKESFWDYFLRYTRYHSRYVSLSKEDFLPDMGDVYWTDWKGFGNNMAHTPFPRPEILNVSERTPMTQKTETYYRAIIELCLEREISLEIVVTPYALHPTHQAIFNYASDIAAQYHVPFTNCNLIFDEFGFDYELDLADKDHANHKGNVKISRHLAEQFEKKYTLNDRRNNPLYATWQKDADYYWQSICNQELKECTDFAAYFHLLNTNPHYTFLISPADESPIEIINYLNIRAEETNFIVKNQDDILAQFNSLSPRPFIQLCSVMISLDNANNTLVNGAIVEKNKNGINLLIYDAITDTIADNVTFDVDNNSMVIHQ